MVEQRKKTKLLSNLLNYKPSELINKINSSLSKEIRITFFAALIIGFLAHLYPFFNKLWNYDELATTPRGYGTCITSGRWFLWFLGIAFDKLLGNFSMPWFIGMISLLLLACSACLIVHSLKIKDKVHCILIAGVFITFPAVTSMYFFMYTAGYYSLSILLNVIAGYLIIKNPLKIRNHLLAAILIACSLGIYQAHFPIVVCMLLTHLFILSLSEKKDWITHIRTGLLYLTSLITGLILYFIINKSIITIKNVDLSTYQGLNDMGNISLLDFPRLIASCYNSTISLMYKNVYHLNSSFPLKLCICLLFLVLVINLALLIYKRRKSFITNIITTFILLLFPAALFLIQIMVPDGEIYALMLLSVSFVYIIPIVVVEKVTPSIKTVKHLLPVTQISYWIVSICCATIIFVNIWFANGCYMSIQYTNMRDVSYFQTLTTQIKSLDAYDDTLPIAFIGKDFEDDTALSDDLMDEFALGGKKSSNINSYTYARMKLLTYYIGFSPSIVDDSNMINQLQNDARVKAMPNYPDDGSIQIVDNIILIKLSD